MYVDSNPCIVSLSLSRLRGDERSHLQLVEAQREVKDLGELPRQRLLLLQVLCGATAGAGQESQQAVQGPLYNTRPQKSE